MISGVDPDTRLIEPAAGRSFYAAAVQDFLAASDDAILGQLSRKHVRSHASAEADQIRAWQREIEILRLAFETIGSECEGWWLLLETPLLRLGRRMDAVVLAPGVVGIVEFKVGAVAFSGQDRAQAERYASCLRDFHAASQECLVVPILCAERAKSAVKEIEAFEGTAALVETNAVGLALIFEELARHVDSNAPQLDGVSFDMSPYRPTPTIVEAAQALYAGHEIAEIGRGDAADAELQAAAAALQEIAAAAESSRAHIICFVTGAPGAGKTLLGLDLALKSRTGTRPAAMLSGNRPLVHVLTEALATDRAKRSGSSKAQAKYEAGAAIQNLLGYLKEHTDGSPPPEHVIVFDEAQRAWDREVGLELMGRPNSEPELFLDILARLDWACLICLVGPGQEINRGEGGLRLWGEALASPEPSRQFWTVVAAPQALDGGPDVAGWGLTAGGDLTSARVQRESKLHLANSMRAYRNPMQGRWVAALLAGDIPGARDAAAAMTSPPAMITRNLEAAKTWLRARRIGGRSVGLLASAGSVRLVAEGLPPTPQSNELGPIGHWFLKPYTDYRSSSALEVPLSEYGAQGLELDFAGVCWGGDLIWRDGSWLPRIMRAPKWTIARDPEKVRFRLNGYRVLLTRARAGLVIYVPAGSNDDETRLPAEMDAVAETLMNAGCEPLAEGHRPAA